MKKISINLTKESEEQLNYLLKDYNRFALQNITMSQMIRVAITNQFVHTNVQHVYEREKNLCEKNWLKTYESQK